MNQNFYLLKFFYRFEATRKIKIFNFDMELSPPQCHCPFLLNPIAYGIISFSQLRGGGGGKGGGLFVQHPRKHS